MSIQCGSLQFRDWMNMVAAGTSLDRFMASQGFPNSKLQFPWDWFSEFGNVCVCVCVCVIHSTSFLKKSQLKQTFFPSQVEFSSKLKGTTIDLEDYTKMKDIFDSQCKDMYDFLLIYAKRSVEQ